MVLDYINVNQPQHWFGLATKWLMNNKLISVIE